MSSVMVRREPFKPSPPNVDVNEFINKKTRLKPGLSEDFIALNKEINKNVKYVLGEDQKESEERREINDETNKGDHHDV